MSDDIKSGDLVLVIRCKECGHTVQVTGIPADDEGRAYQSFRHVCPKCDADQRVQLSDILKAKAFRKN